MPKAPWFRCLPLLPLAALACHEIDYSHSQRPGAIEIYDDLFAVSAPTPQLAVAVGYYGAIYQTENGGDSWAKRASGGTASLYDVSMADERRGWTVGQRGLVLRTADGGQTWSPQDNLKVEQGTHLFAVHAIDASRAWAVGEWGTRLYTDNGGQSWQDLALTIDEKHPRFVWLAPVEQERVYAGEKVYEDVGLNDVFCLAPPSQRCWIVGEFGYIFWSDDLGRNWQRGTILGEIKMDPIKMQFDKTELSPADVERLRQFAKLLVDEQHLNVEVEPRASEQEIARYGKDDDPYEMFEILDARLNSVRSVLEEVGLLSDRIRLRGQPPWDFEDFIEEDPDFLKRYFDERKADQPGLDIGVAQNPYLFTVHFKDEENGLISGLGGVMLRSADGGRTWRYVKLDRKQALFSVASANGRAIAVGEKGFVRVSTDGGAQWHPPQQGFPELFTFMRNIDFTPGLEHGFIVGQRGMVLRSDDRGQSWKRVLPPEADRYAQSE